MQKVTNDIYYVGVNDHKVDLFEGQYKVPNGMAYNSYVIMDDLITVMDTVDQNFTTEWLNNIEEVLNGKMPNYIVIQHMEPDHSANLMNFLNKYPQTTVVGNSKTFKMMEQFFHTNINNTYVVNDKDTLNIGRHTLTFITAPMVHWPEVMFTYDATDKVLFSADAFGKFGALDVLEPWVDEARRYYIGIVGKYGVQVQNVLKKASTLDINIICPLHGPVLKENLGYYLNLYNIWSSYKKETEGIVVLYTSVYGNTKKAVEYFVQELKNNNATKVEVFDLSRCDMSIAVAKAFEYGKVVFATTTYNAGVFPHMEDLLTRLTERNFQNKEIAIIENGSWAPMVVKVIKSHFENSKDLTYLQPVRIMSSMNDENKDQLSNLAKELCREYIAKKDVEKSLFDKEALYNIGYGLYVVTTNDGKKDNGLIVNTVSQLTDSPFRVAVNINKKNYSATTIELTKKLNVNCLSIDAPFEIFERYGFSTGAKTNKFDGVDVLHSANGLVVLSDYINAFISLEVEQTIDLDTHKMFICKVTESKTMSTKETMTYTYYQKNVKPKPATSTTGYVCKVCGYVYEGQELPDDYICPLCKHGANDFEKIS